MANSASRKIHAGPLRRDPDLSTSKVRNSNEKEAWHLICNTKGRIYKNIIVTEINVLINLIGWLRGRIQIYIRFEVVMQLQIINEILICLFFIRVMFRVGVVTLLSQPVKWHLSRFGQIAGETLQVENMAEIGNCPIFAAENGNVVHISADSDRNGNILFRGSDNWNCQYNCCGYRKL